MVTFSVLVIIAFYKQTRELVNQAFIINEEAVLKASSLLFAELNLG